MFEDVSCQEEQYFFRVDFGLDRSSCWFNLRDLEGGDLFNVNSGYFSLSTEPVKETSDAVESSTTPTTSTATSTAASTMVSATESSEAPTTTDSSTSDVATNEPAAGASSTTSDPGNADGGLSNGAKIGVGVGVSLGVIGMASLAGAFWLVRRRRQGGASKGQAPHSPVERHEMYAGSNDEYTHGYYKTDEVGSQAVRGVS